MMDTPKKQPWLKFYPGDWRQDVALGGCSLAARGLWIEMISMMWQADPRGSLVHAEKAITAEKLAMQVRATVKEVKALLDELREAKVFSADDDGTIFSRRIRRDILKAAADRENGKGGGNPRLKLGVNPQDKPTDKAHGRAGAGDSEARSQKPEAATQLGASASFDEAMTACSAAVGTSEVADVVFGPIMLLIEQGIPLTRITTVLRSVAEERRAKGLRPIKYWSKWAQIIVERLDAAPKVETKPAGRTVEIRGVAVPFANIETCVQRWQDGGFWNPAWDDPPDRPGCAVPRAVLDELGVKLTTHRAPQKEPSHA